MKIVKILITIIVVVGVVFGAINLIKKRKQEILKEKTAIIYPIKVKSFFPKKEKIVVTLPYLAEVKSDKDIILTSKFNGKLLYVKNVGQKVKQGEVVAKIDDLNLKTELKEINYKILSLKEKIKAQKLTLSNLIVTHKRTKSLLDVKMASIEEFQNEENQIASLKSQIKIDTNEINSLISKKENILNDIKYTIIKSPIDGVISDLFINENENVFASKPILKISSTQGNYLFITLPTQKKEIIYKNKKYPLIPLNISVNGLLGYRVDVNDTNLINSQKVNIDVVEFDDIGIKVPYDGVLSIDKNYIFNQNGKFKEVNILAQGKKYVVIDKSFDEIILAKPDILLKIKAGYPVKVGE